MEYKFFQNNKCEFYPCHDIETINCIFCFCPLYNYKCLGNYSYTKDNIKDCSKCNYPHTKSGYDNIIEFLKENYNRIGD